MNSTETAGLSLTESEWRVMECLWERSPQTGRQLTDALEAKAGWNRSTTLTLIRRLEGKNAIAHSEGERVLEYRPLISRDDAVLAETESFLSRLYHGSVSMLVSAMTRKQKLSDEEIAELYALLREQKGDGDD